MSRRGSAQLLLLFFRSRKTLGWTLGILAAILLAAGLDFPLPTQAGLAQTLRQSAWQHALAGLPEQAPWPWAETSSPIASSVPQLGLSASALKAAGPDGHVQLETIEPAPAQDPHLPPAQLSDVSVGDRITLTTADGSSSVYQVTGRKVVDPHLAATGPVASGDDPAPGTCMPLDPLLASSLRLVIEATKLSTPAAAEASPEL
jgi:hypothetical protein